MGTQSVASNVLQQVLVRATETKSNYYSSCNNTPATIILHCQYASKTKRSGKEKGWKGEGV